MALMILLPAFSPAGAAQSRELSAAVKINPVEAIDLGIENASIQS